MHIKAILGSVPSISSEVLVLINFLFLKSNITRFKIYAGIYVTQWDTKMVFYFDEFQVEILLLVVTVALNTYWNLYHGINVYLSPTVVCIALQNVCKL